MPLAISLAPHLFLLREYQSAKSSIYLIVNMSSSVVMKAKRKKCHGHAVALCQAASKLIEYCLSSWREDGDATEHMARKGTPTFVDIRFWQGVIHISIWVHSDATRISPRPLIFTSCLTRNMHVTTVNQRRQRWLLFCTPLLRLSALNATNSNPSAAQSHHD